MECDDDEVIFKWTYLIFLENHLKSIFIPDCISVPIVSSIGTDQLIDQCSWSQKNLLYRQLSVDVEEW